jgi:hypothetical protein
MEEVLARVNADVRGILDDALAHGENPRLVALLRAVITLTNSDEARESEDEKDSASKQKAKEAAELAAQIADLQKKLKSL